MPFAFFELHPESSRSIAQQIEDEIKRQITHKILLPGERLPTIREAAKTLQCGIVSVNRAYVRLRDQEILISKGTYGMFVAELEDGDITSVARDGLIDEMKKVVREGVLCGFDEDKLREVLRIAYEEVLEENEL